jgi:hypothetical protein
MPASKSFTALGQTGKLQGRRFLAVIGKDGGPSFTATVQLKWVDGDGNVHTAAASDGTPVNLTVNNQMTVVDFGAKVTAYLECTAYTSGTCTAYLAADPLLYGR